MRDSSKYTHHLFAYATVAALFLQALLFVVSWLIAAAMPEENTRSLLFSEGIRWFFGSLVSNVASRLLVWILMLAMAWGAVSNSGLAKFFTKKKKSLAYRQRFALRVVIIEAIIAVCVIVMMAFVPNAPLRSVSGQLYPSSFSNSQIPILALTVILMAITYGMLSGTIKGIVDAFNALTDGLRKFIPLIIFYLAVVQLYYSIIYVFQL